eukprot:TRINITY_DN7178_c0_g1_i1.p1 TRINITY_DN7178_c0_g1~~TRINITY_DN7178_c0_g1_i1.p1  ORF type:complete len:636 (-),score=106.38 TRINITY_DN7178_c0_g1_i1:48-1955(-)
MQRRTVKAKPNAVSTAENLNNPFTLNDLAAQQYSMPTPHTDEEVYQKRIDTVFESLVALHERLMRERPEWMRSDEGIVIQNEMARRTGKLIEKHYEVDDEHHGDGSTNIKRSETDHVVEGSIGSGMMDWQFQKMVQMMQKWRPDDSPMHIPDRILGKSSAPSGLSSKHARFGLAYKRNGDYNNDALSKAIHQCMCEIDENGAISSSMAVGKIGTALNGGSGYKNRNPEMVFFRDNGQKKELDEKIDDPGFINPGSAVAIDEERKLIWVAGDKRIKAFKIELDRKTFGDCEFTLYAAKETNYLALINLDGQDSVISASGKSQNILIWKVNQLQKHEADVNVSVFSEKHKNFDGLLSESEVQRSMRDDDEDEDSSGLEVTKGQNATAEIAIPSNDYGMTAMVATLLPDTIAIAGDDCSVDLLNLKTGKFVYRMLGHTNEVSGLAVCKEAPHILASCSGDSAVRIWNIQTGQRMWTFSGNTASLSAIALAHTESAVFAFAGAWNNAIRVFDVTKGQFLYEIGTGGGSVTELGWNPASNSLYCLVEGSRETDKSMYDSDEEEEGGKEKWALDLELGEFALLRYRFKAGCASCENPVATKKCGGCESVVYCNRECQTAHWAVHKPICQELRKQKAQSELS